MNVWQGGVVLQFPPHLKNLNDIEVHAGIGPGAIRSHRLLPEPAPSFQRSPVKPRVCQILAQSPITRDRNSGNVRNVPLHVLLPSIEVHRAGKRGHHHELRKSQFCLLWPELAVAPKVSSRSEESPKMKDPSTCTPCSLNA